MVVLRVKLCLGKAQHSTGSPCRAPIQGTQDSPEAATIDFWNALASAPAPCLHKLVLVDNLQDAFLHGVQSLIAFAVLATIYLLKSKVFLS